MNKHVQSKKSRTPPLGQLSLFPDASHTAESGDFLSEQLITYIGNKRRLLPLIESTLLRARDLLGCELISFADVFAGTGAVARMARRWSHTLLINDFEAYSAYSNAVYHQNFSDVDLGEIDAARLYINEIADSRPMPGFITELYSPADEGRITRLDRVFYTRRNAMFIDTNPRWL